MSWGWGGGAGATNEEIREVAEAVVRDEVELAATQIVQEETDKVFNELTQDVAAANLARAYGEYASQIHGLLPPDEGLTPLEMHARQNNAFVWIQLRDIRVLFNERGLITITGDGTTYDVFISNWRFVRIKDSVLEDNEVRDQIFRLDQYTNTKYQWPAFDITDPKWVEAKSANGIITDTLDLNPTDDDVEGGV